MARLGMTRMSLFRPSAGPKPREFSCLFIVATIKLRHYQRMVVAFSMFTKIGCLRISVHLTQFIFASCFALSIARN